jgi:translation initiation factor 2 alpha subunit (eIF-2alpha)
LFKLVSNITATVAEEAGEGIPVKSEGTISVVMDMEANSPDGIEKIKMVMDGTMSLTLKE